MHMVVTLQTLVKNDKERDEVIKDGSTSCHNVAVKQQSTLVKNTTDHAGADLENFKGRF